ncbi:MAG: methionine--tRNA ligase [Candidatus Pacebacteria bacterium]|nr:methionine--tRNA ligase [Candidatus Paceibacterota bacterium]
MKIKEIIEYSDFEKVDIRIGKVIASSSPDWSNKLLEFTVYFGEEIGEKTIFSGIKKWYAPDDFIGNYYLFVVNLAERKMGEGVSQGMMLMSDEEEKPIPFPITKQVEEGAIVR